MSEITCPECGHATDLPAIRRAAEEFCSHCDFPLFWAPSSIPAMVPGSNSDATLRRLPGAGGRHRVGSKICPACGELNPLTETHCIRCSVELDPKPVVVKEEPKPLPPPPAPPPPEPIVTPWWWWVLAAALTLAIAVPIIVAL